MSISNIKSTSVKINYTDIASIAAKQDGYNAGLAIFVDAAKSGVEHKIRVVQWDDHPMDATKSVLSRIEWTVPSTVTMADSIACKQAIATMIQAGESREEVLASIAELLRSHEAAATELAAIRKARITGGKVPPVVMNSPAATNNELATVIAMLTSMASRLDKLEAKQIPNELA